MFVERALLWSDSPPEPRSRLDNWPSVLFSWWCTSFATVIIITRLLGRKVRSNELFREDWLTLLSLPPLWIRMVFVHFVLIYGTNNTDTEAHSYTDEQIRLRSMGARLVLGARIFYALFIWIMKLAVSEFLKRITIRIWRRRYEITLQAIRVFLFFTFGAVVVATLTECHPFDHYWQVIPDPGPSCRHGYAQLLTMGTCDIITDIVLIAFPIPVVLSSGQTWKRKLQMVSLFSLSLIMIGMTATRMPKVIEARGTQQYRTVWASAEILASTFVVNAVTLGSFLRDKGAKKNKYKRSYSVSESVDRASARRPTVATLYQFDSNDDDDDDAALFHSMGYGIPAHLRSRRSTTPRPAPPALTAREGLGIVGEAPEQYEMDTREAGGSSESDNSFEAHKKTSPTTGDTPTTQRLSLFDVGHLLEGHERSTGRPLSQAMTVESGCADVSAQDFAQHAHADLGSRAFLRDVGGMLNTNFVNELRNGALSPRGQHGAQDSWPAATAPIGVLGPMLERRETQVSLQDAGGLLGPAAHPLPADTTTLSSVYGSGAHPSASSQNKICFSDERDWPLRDDTQRGQPDRQATAMPMPFAQGPDDMVLHDPGGLINR